MAQKKQLGKTPGKNTEARSKTVRNTGKKKPAQPTELRVPEMVTLRIDHYVRGYKILRNTLLGTLVLSSMFVFSYMLKGEPPPAVIGMDTAGRAIPLETLDKPFLNESDLKNWVSGVVRELNTYDYVNYREQVNHALGKYFSKKGATSFLNSAESNGVFKAVEDSGAVVTTIALKSPVVKWSRVQNGRRFWYVKVPVRSTYSTRNSGTPTQDYMVNLMIGRTSLTNSEKGVLIEQYVASEYDPG
jgi:intracellular multiplication protein IcmL